MNLVCTSDWHEDDLISARHPTMRGDSAFGLQQIVDLCLNLRQQDETYLLGAGDLADTRDPSPETQCGMHRQFDRLRDANVPLYFIQGQHERDSVIPRLSAHPWPTWLHKQQVKLSHNFRLYGLDWQPPGLLPQALAEIPADTTMFMTHQVWKEHMPDVAPSEGSFTQIPTIYTLTGDLHEHKVTAYLTPTGVQAVALSPGSTCMQATNEPPQKAIYVMKVTATGCSLEEVPLLTRTFFKTSIQSEDDLQLLQAQLPHITRARPELPPDLQKPQLVVRCDASLPEISRRVTQLVGDTCHLFLSMLPKRELIARIGKDERERIERPGLLSCLSLVVPPDTPVYFAAARLLSSVDPVAELDRMEQEFITSPVGNHANQPSPLSGSVPAP